MTSPSTPGVIHPARAGAVRVAFYGRVASADDPHAAIAQQLRVVTAALPAQTPLVGYFADVGPGNGPRGGIHSTATWSLDGHPVDGGLIDLLDRACQPDRHFDVIACADVDRLSRRPGDRARIENTLAEHGVRVVTPDDPMIAAPQPLDTASKTHKRTRGHTPAPSRPPRGPRGSHGPVSSAPSPQRRTASGRHPEAEPPEVVLEIRALQGPESEQLAAQQARVLWEVTQWLARNKSERGPQQAA